MEHLSNALNANIPHIRERLYQYALLARFHRPIGALLLLWPTMWALWLAAEGVPNVGLLFIFVAGVFVMRGAGCVINDIADREFDGHVERTRERPLVTGKVRLREGLLLFLSMLTVALALVSFLNVLTLKLALIGLALAITYPRLAAAMVAKLIRGLGADRVLWGTDSIWFGSPQWQIEAFRRIEVPADLQDKCGLAPLGPADGPSKRAIFGGNAAAQYGIQLDARGRPVENYKGDELTRLKAEYLAAGNQRDNLLWGWIRKQKERD